MKITEIPGLKNFVVSFGEVDVCVRRARGEEDGWWEVRLVIDDEYTLARIIETAEIENHLRRLHGIFRGEPKITSVKVDGVGDIAILCLF